MRYIIIIGLLFYSAFAKAQLESSQWFFGVNGGIDFSSGTAVAINTGQLITGEGCATISDSAGNLLFYTDGGVVYDTNHVLMPNGTGLLGDSSSTSSAIIVPLPDDANIYYIFTVDTDDQMYRNSLGLHYSVVDLRLNGGTGDIDTTQKNINLLPITSEKLTAVANAAGDGFWVITQFEDRYFAYEITASGINLTPVISTVAPFIELVVSTDSNVDVAAMRGYIKINARGNKLAAAHFSNNTTADLAALNGTTLRRSTAYVTGGELYLYDFNNVTGVVSNPVPLLTKADGGSIYGVEFSGNGQYLYAEVDYMNASSTTTFDFISGEIIQYDITATNIAASRVQVYQDNIGIFRGALQLGLDSKIYHSRINQNALSVIDSPDQSGINANYLYNNFGLTPMANAFFGLPIFVQSFLATGEISGQDHCFGNEQFFSVSTSGTIDSIIWDFGDPASGAQNSSTLEMPSHLFTAPGTYTVTATVTTLVNTFTESLMINVFENVTVPVNDLTITLCDEGFDTATINLDELVSSFDPALNQSYNFYTDFNDATMQINEVVNTASFRNSTSPQTIFLRVSNSNCFEILEVLLTVENCEIEIFNVVTPNDDGNNDTFIVNGLRDVYDKHKIYIFTRYGQKIWEGDNDTPAWSGKSNTGLFYNSEERLPTGTYFYVIELNEPGTTNKAGFIYLN